VYEISESYESMQDPGVVVTSSKRAVDGWGVSRAAGHASLDKRLHCPHAAASLFTPPYYAVQG